MKHVMRTGTGSRWHRASLVGFLILWFAFYLGFSFGLDIASKAWRTDGESVV